MATNFPTSLDTWPTITDNTTRIDASYINNIQDAVEALEAKVGIVDDPTDTMEYKITGFWNYSPKTTIYLYNNTAPTNWTIVEGVGDSVLAAKGGSTYTTGGSKQGSWTITGISSDSHNHPWYYQASSYGYTYNSGGTLTAMTSATYIGESGIGNVVGIGVDNFLYRQPSTAYSEVVQPTTGNYFYTDNDSHSHTHGGTWRPAGAVGIIAQYDG
jgi:hypothetical protein